MSIQNWQATAFNPATTTSNQIHSDEMAQAYGFRGGLVPGVTISSYLMHPAVLAWGENWLHNGQADIRIHKPLYDGVDFEVRIMTESDKQTEVELRDAEGTLNATGTLQLKTTNTAPQPIYRGDRILTSSDSIPDATPETMARLQREGMKALKIRWDDSHNMARYLQNESHMPKLHRPTEGGFAHGAFLLGITNWVLAGNAYMNPWVHLETSSQFLAPVPYGTELIAECEVKDLFCKKGHDFVDVAVNLFEMETQHPVMSATLRAIYRMRAA